VVAGGVAIALNAGGEPSPSSTASDAPATRSNSTPPSGNPTSAPSSSTSEAAEVLTPANSPELAALFALTDYCDPSIATFADRHAGALIEFDGSISYMTNHGSYETRYDFLIAPDDRGTESTVGPAMKYENVGMIDLHLAGDYPDTIGAGDLLHVTAKVIEYNPTQCLFFLDPVATVVR